MTAIDEPRRRFVRTAAPASREEVAALALAVRDDPAAAPHASPLSADALYGRLLASAAQHLLGTGPEPRARLRLADGRARAAAAGPLAGTRGRDRHRDPGGVEAPVLDLGCGPGRHLAALREAGKRGLGVDLSPVAVRLARGRGADAINGSLWSQVPRAGTWRTILLLDGNIGIGGAPILLLRRAGELLAPGGAIVVETDPAGAPTQAGQGPAGGAGRRVRVVPVGTGR